MKKRMSVIILPNAIGGRSIALQTKLAKDIANWQPERLSQFTLNQVADFPKKYPLAITRCPPQSAYNCHGFTFASRRTWIEDVNEIHKILVDDGYKEIPINDVLPGDVIVYFDDRGDAEHSGIVIKAPEGVLKIPVVCSKWGGYGEVMHDANYGPYNTSIWKFYRII